MVLKAAKDMFTSSNVTEDHLEFSAPFIYVIKFQIKIWQNAVEDINADSAISQFEELPKYNITLIEMISMCLIVFANNIAQSNEELEKFHNHLNGNTMYKSSQGLLPIYHINQHESSR